MEEMVQDLISYLESASIFLQQGFGDLALDEIELAKQRANDLQATLNK